MEPDTDTAELRLDLLTASAGAWRLSLILRTKGLQPDPYVDLEPETALQLGEWLVARARERGATHRAIADQKAGPETEKARPRITRGPGKGWSRMDRGL